jgi:hypothetical protein
VLIQALGPQHLEVADAYCNLGDTCMKLLVETRDQTKLAEARKWVAPRRGIK